MTKTLKMLGNLKLRDIYEEIDPIGSKPVFSEGDGDEYDYFHQELELNLNPYTLSILYEREPPGDIFPVYWVRFQWDLKDPSIEQFRTFCQKAEKVHSRFGPLEVIIFEKDGDNHNENIVASKPHQVKSKNDLVNAVTSYIKLSEDIRE